MAEEGEVEIIDSGVQNAGPPNQRSMTETGALVEVTFQKEPYQKNKYLEAEPKALGITQIMLSLFTMSIRLATLEKKLMSDFFVGSLALFGLIAGGVAVGAQNLHLPTLKACLGVQVMMCVVSVICFINSMVTYHVSFMCWTYSQNRTLETTVCNRLQDTYDHIMGVELLAQAAQIALSATLAAFCCKVIQCCSPRTSVPVIAVNTARGPQ
ncbi:hypothetical protein P4O66_008371 [Electrophorus voltai]|uniref:Uncharacterized protein n=2 Tax=Electrophorus TaxID=8004 RepID=A0A4W4GBG1_ELEEL|nr:hypothetical protein P4O66_008371 [Electrophorus voltai]